MYHKAKLRRSILHLDQGKQVVGEEVRLFDSRVGETTMPRSSFMKQWSGFALIFSEPAATAAIYPAANLDTIVGGCCGHPRSPSDLGDDGCDKNCGMPGWSVNPVNMNFRVGDTPMWWSPPAGPHVEMSLLFNSLDSLNNCEFFGEKWSFKYSSTLHKTTSIEGPDGKVFSYIYHANGKLKTLIFPKGDTTSGAPATDPYKIHYSYETNNKDLDKIQRYLTLNGPLETLLDIDYWPGTRDMKQSTDALGHITSYAAPHPNGLPTSVSDDTTGDVVTFTYDQGSDDTDGYPT